MASADRSPTRGGEALAKCADSHAEIAERIGYDKSLVTRWVTGERKPTIAQAQKLDDVYGIPAGAWREPAAPRPRAPTPPFPDDSAEDNNERLNRYIRDGMRELELDTDLSGVKRAEALKKLVDAQVALDKSTGENALTMTKIAAHPEFKRVVRLITDAIAPHPEVLAKVVDVLRANP
jgi:transcriptional regulator with XRE-family HTH domain